MNKKPVIVVGRKLPESIEARLTRDYEPRFNADDKLYSTDVLLA